MAGLARRCARRWLGLLVTAALATAALAPAALAVPHLDIRTPERFERQAERIRNFDPQRLRVAMRLAGLEEPGAPIPVILAPEDSPQARMVRSWVAGYALGDQGPIVLFPTRSPTYPESSLEELLHHEVAHILIARSAAGHEVPRWFNEGVAMVAGGAWNLGDSSRFSLDVMRRGETPLHVVDRLFQGGGGAASRAYAISGAFVQGLRDRHGPWVSGDILQRVGQGVEFEAAFREVIGRDLATEEEAFWRRQTLWRRWLPFLSSGTALWLGVTLLALWAFKRRRDRDAALAAEWERHERGIWREDPPEWIN
ncbi:MAG: hypothetical protein AAF604_02725 [Acidobacteriota bacterium]